MRIYAVADIHGKAENISRIAAIVPKAGADLLVVAGDLTRYRSSRKAVSQLNRLAVPCFAIRGNTDWPAVDRWLSAFPNTRTLHLKAHIREGIHFVGAGGTVPLPFRSRIRLSENRLLRHLSPLITRRTILVAHPPPYGTLDRALGRYHVGSRNLHRFLVDAQPRLFICGHVHEDSGVGQIGGTAVVNCAMSRACAGALIDLDAKSILQIEMLDAQ